MANFQRTNSQSQTKLKEHKFTGKKLIPPFAQLNMTPASWIDTRLPEMLWASLFTKAFPRKEALKRFSAIVNVACQVTDIQDPHWRKRPLAVTLSGISNLKEPDKKRIMQVIASDNIAKKALAPILFFDNLPAKKQWGDVLNSPPKKEDWEQLAKAVSLCFFHQSQEATDCRWVKVLYALRSGFIVGVTGNAKEIPELVSEYPNHKEEQLRLSRPTVRSCEISLDINDPKYNWSKNFWKECYEKTRCIPSKLSEEELKALYPTEEKLKEDKDKLHEINQALSDHFWKTAKGSGRDPKHEVAFGLALYAGDIATSSILLGMGRTSQGRMTLRAMVECLISLKYLATKDNSELWLAFRSHGMGQAKLVIQRAEEEGRAPKYLDQKNLGQIANDDVWVEFLPVDIGSWDDSDLRKRAIEVGLKERYDDYYTWPSSFSHGQWGAIREVVYDLCGNPLHRFHRIPLLYSLNLQDTRDDVFLLLNDIVNLVYEIFPKNDQPKDKGIK